MSTPGEQAAPGPVVPDVAPAVHHEVTLVDHHRFTQPVCSCGWVGAGRRARRLARDEARDHVLLYADAGPRAATPAPAPDASGAAAGGVAAG